MMEIDKTRLSDQTKFRLYEIKKIENYFINEINERELYSKKLSKYVTIFDCFKCTNWRNINYFIYNYYWCTNSKCKIYFNFFYNNMNH